MSTTTLSTRLLEIIFDGLIEVDDRFEAKPRLAESWEHSQDGRTWTFHLKHGVRFHDGAELTADDAAFTFVKMKQLSNRIPFVFNFQDMEAVHVKDKYTFQITLKKALASFLRALDISILPKHLLEGQDIEKTSFNLHPVGTGPFKLKSWSDKEIILEANESYFLGRPYLDKIRVIVYPNREAAWAKLMAGAVDFFDFLTPDHYEILKQVPSFNFYSVPMPYYYLLAFNLKKELFRDQKVRQALNYAVNKEEIVAKVLKGQGQPAAGTIFPGSWAYSSNLKPYPYDPKKALALLAEAGWEDHDGDHLLDKNGRPLEFTVYVNSGDDIKQKTLLLIQQQLFDIGVRINIVLFDPTDPGFLFKKQFDTHFPEIIARGDPDTSYKFWHSSQIKNGFNVSSYRNKKVDQLLEVGKVEFDQEKRKAIYFKFEKEMHDDPPGIFLFWTNYLVGVHQRFKGVKISPVGPFANIREWYVPKDEQRHTKSEELSSAEGK
ncbi:MAG: peptide-binding protein [Nitrospirae bacterium]|nr:peptide-binding protein [Nitrospirota bacterium]